MGIANIEIPAQSREVKGKGASRRLRHKGEIPAIVYGGDKAPQQVTLEHRIIIKALEDEKFYTSIFKLNIDKTTENVILRDLQRHPYKPKVLHADFQRVKPTDFVTMSIPLHFLNEEQSPAVKLDKAIINHQLVDVTIKCQAGKLPEHIDVDLGELTVDKPFALSDLKLPEGATIPELALGPEHNIPVAAAHVTRAAKAEDEGGQEAGEATQE